MHRKRAGNKKAALKNMNDDINFIKNRTRVALNFPDDKKKEKLFTRLVG